MGFNPIDTELTTAATDGAMCALCLGLAIWLMRMPGSTTWRRRIWVWMLCVLAFASALGAIAHGLDWSPAEREAIWQPLYLSLGLTVALFLVGAICDWRGEAAARTLLPWAVGLAVAFFVASRVFGGSFLIFVVYEGAAMVGALAIYLLLWRVRRVPGNAMVAGGIAISLAAAAVQASTLSVRVIVPFDHNGLFHVIQMIGTVVLACGLRQDAEAPLPRARRRARRQS